MGEIEKEMPVPVELDANLDPLPDTTYDEDDGSLLDRDAAKEGMRRDPALMRDLAAGEETYEMTPLRGAEIWTG